MTTVAMLSSTMTSQQMKTATRARSSSLHGKNVFVFFFFFLLVLSFCTKNESFFLQILYCRSPDVAKVRTKMLYASSKDRFKRELDGIQVELQVTDPSEMSWDILKARAY